jgi:hypothetical protein
MVFQRDVLGFTREENGNYVSLAGFKIFFGGAIGKWLMTTFGQQGLTTVSNGINLFAQSMVSPCGCFTCVLLLVSRALLSIMHSCLSCTLASHALLPIMHSRLSYTLAPHTLSPIMHSCPSYTLASHALSPLIHSRLSCTLAYHALLMH